MPTEKDSSYGNADRSGSILAGKRHGVSRAYRSQGKAKYSLAPVDAVFNIDKERPAAE
jgi:hypothetical protein